MNTSKMFHKPCISAFATQNRRLFFIVTKQMILYRKLVTIHLPNNFLDSFRRTQCSHFSTTNFMKLDSTSNSDSTSSDLVNNSNVISLQKILDCNSKEAAQVYQCLLTTQGDDSIDWRMIIKTVRWLHRVGATTPIIISNCHILLYSIGTVPFQLKRKFCFCSNHKTFLLK